MRARACVCGGGLGKGQQEVRREGRAAGGQTDMDYLSSAVKSAQRSNAIAMWRCAKRPSAFANSWRCRLSSAVTSLHLAKQPEKGKVPANSVATTGRDLSLNPVWHFVERLCMCNGNRRGMGLSREKCCLELPCELEVGPAGWVSCLLTERDILEFGEWHLL